MVNWTGNTQEPPWTPTLDDAPKIWIEKGKNAARAGKKAEARYYFRSVLAVAPDHPDALLWMAYLAGGGRPSLVLLARLLEADPTNQRARAAIRWVRLSVWP